MQQVTRQPAQGVEARTKLGGAIRNRNPFGVAGIWENWHNAAGQWERTFCIITVPANELVGTVHDRMPAIIPIVEHPRWLGPDSDPRDLLKPYPARLMKRVPKPPKRKRM